MANPFDALRKPTLHVEGDTKSSMRRLAPGITIGRLGDGPNQVKLISLEASYQRNRASGWIEGVGANLAEYTLVGVAEAASIRAKGDRISARGRIEGEFDQLVIDGDVGILISKKFAGLAGGIQYVDTHTAARVSSDLNGITSATVSLPGGFACQVAGA